MSTSEAGYKGPFGAAERTVFHFRPLGNGRWKVSAPGRVVVVEGGDAFGEIAEDVEIDLEEFQIPTEPLADPVLGLLCR